MNYTMKVLLENAGTFREKNEVRAIEESEKMNLDNIMVSKLYKSAIEKAHIDFDNIPESKGDIEAYEGYPVMVESLETVKALAQKQSIKIEEIEVLEKTFSNLIAYRNVYQDGFALNKSFIQLQYNALVAQKQSIKIEEIEVLEKTFSNLIAYRNVYQDGFALNKSFIQLQYNALVMACVEATSSIIASYMDYITRPSDIEFKIIKDKKNNGTHCITILRKYNDSVKSGEYQKLINAIVNHKDGFIGMETGMVMVAIVGGALTIVPLLRELIFYFFYSRMKISEYLQIQAMLIELNRSHVESMNLTSKKKKEVLKKQEQMIKTLTKLSDKLKVSQKMATAKTMEEVKKEEKKWTLDGLKQEVIKSDNTFTLL